MKLISIVEESIESLNTPPKFTKAFTISDGAANLIKNYEGFSSKAYKDTDGQMVIGYGTRLPNSSYLKKEIDKNTGHSLLLQHLNKHVVPAIKTTIKRSLNQNQWDALASLIYNIGAANFKNSNLAKVINDGKLKEIRKEWLEWRLSGGKVLGGLEKRRLAEVNLFFK